MKMDVKIPTDQEVEEMRRRRLEAMHLQVIEDNPLDDEDIAMFEMFERKKWSAEQRRDYILQWARDLALKSS